MIGLRIRRGEHGGLISEADDEGFRFAWDGPNPLFPLFENVSVAQLKLPAYSGLEVLTLTEGWKPMANEFDVERPRSLVEDLEDLFAEVDESEAAELKESRVEETLEALEEAQKSVLKKAAGGKSSGKAAEKASRLDKRSPTKKKGASHNPFKTKSHLGPGPRAGENSQTNNWKCACPTPYKCMCRSGKRRKVVRINRGYKQAYNKQYKSWRKDKRF